MNHPKLKDPLPEWDQPLHIQQDPTLPRMTLEDWFNYVRNEPSSEMQFGNGIRDKGRQHMRLKDFQDQHARDANLEMAHILALRLYTTKVFGYINNPLRPYCPFYNLSGKRRGSKHPMPATVLFLQEGLKRLRKVAEKELKRKVAASESTSLWRGFKSLEVKNTFLQEGGTELAPMSTSTNLKVAAQYSCTGAFGETALIMKLKIDKNDFMSYGAGLKWLSAFPGEDERLYPPLTYLKPTSRKQSEIVEGINFKIVEVEPTLN